MTTRSCVILAALGCILIAATPAPAHTSGNDFRHFSQNERLTYVLGVLDAWQIQGPMLSGVAPTEQAATKHFGALSKCAADKPMSGAQILAIVDKYIADNPAEWHMTTAFLVWKAMTVACK